MAVSIATFLVQYPEFSETDTNHVQAALDQAALETPAAVHDDNADKVIMLRTAHALAMGPAGSNARVEGQPGETTYSLELRKYEVLGACGLGRVA